ncbi:MAG: transglycosylase domain-containing protein [Anaerolineaceae bacterium]
MENNLPEEKAPEPMLPYGSDFTEPEDSDASLSANSAMDHLPAHIDEFEGYGSDELLDKMQPELAKEAEVRSSGENLEETGAWFVELERFDDQEYANQRVGTVDPFMEDTGFFEGHWTKSESPQKSASAETGYFENGWRSEGLPVADPDSTPTIPPTVTEMQSESLPFSLPQPVAEIDPSATMLNQVAFSPTDQSKPQAVNFAGASQPVSIREEDTQPLPVESVPPAKPPKPPKRAKKKRSGKGWLVTLVILLLMIFVGGAFGVYKYIEIARTLPDVDTLRTRASQFETTRILDRNGNILYEIMDPNAGKRTYVPLNRISPYLIAATLATEDKEYYNHPGFDLVALARALYTNYTSGEIISGASTITQQLARLLLLTDERFEQTYERKAREIILSAEITRRYSKEDVLELYLNEIFYGNYAYGIEAAAETYFNTTAADLNVWQSSFLAGLPQSPAVYDIYQNREATLRRNKIVTVLMYEMSQEKGCIYNGEGLEKVCLSPADAIQAVEALEAYTFEPRDSSMKFPHWVVFIQSLLESRIDAQTIYRSGFTVYTTLDPDFQREAEAAVRDQLAQMTGNNATNGAVIAMDPNTGEILAMVGSADFNNAEISGQVNMALTQTRQPGSSIKPITYLAALEKDWTPSTIIWDVPASLSPSGRPDDYSEPYVPVNYDGRFHGPVTLRSALANSYNVPAVKALQYIGIYDDPATAQEDGFISVAKRLGITNLTRNDYGLSLTLGGGEVSLLEMTGAYAVLANEGQRVAPVAITKVVDHTGKIVSENAPAVGAQVVRPAHAYLISDILSDNEARAPMFGTNSVLNLPFQAAVKTGTTNDYRDNWTIGYTPDLVIGVWVGNADYTPMVNTTGVSGAAPIWSRLMQAGINQFKDGVATSFARPADVVDQIICSVSGTEPSEYCPSQRNEIFASDQLPLPKSEDFWVKDKLDIWSGLRASPDCGEFTEDRLVLNVTDKDAILWLETDAGKAWASNYDFGDPFLIRPERECRVDDPRPIIDLIGLQPGAVIRENPYKISGVISATANFRDFRIEWGEGPEPEEWEVLVDWNDDPAISPQVIYEWDMKDVEAQMITIKVILRSTLGTDLAKKYIVGLLLPTPTPTSTPTPTETPLPTEIPQPTPTPTVPPLPTAIPPTPEPPATDTPVPAPTTGG